MDAVSNRKLFARCSILGLCLTVLSACGKTEFAPVPVSGTITVNGQPAANVLIQFRPQPVNGDAILTGPGSLAFANDEGQFELHVVVGDGALGAMVGPHLVSIYGAESQKSVTEWASEEDFPPGEAPATLRDPPTIKVPQDQFPLAFEVPPGGTSEANFDL